ncbi:MAG: S9 family peptidase, partial [Bacteroidetes bacterium]
MLIGVAVYSQEPLGFQLPPQEIIDLVDAPATPSTSISPDNTTIAFIGNPGLPSLEDLAREELRLGGLRIDPHNNGPSRRSYGISISLTNIRGENERVVTGLPKSPQISNVRWSPDSRHMAFLNTTYNKIELWVLEVRTAQARKITQQAISNVMGNAFSWSSDNQTILFTAVPENRGDVPERPRVADGPVIQENIGRRAAVRTFQDMLTNRHDEELFDYYAMS